MPELSLIDRDVLVHPVFDKAILEWAKRWKLLTYVDILVVVDGGISTTPANDFGIARVIALLRNTKIGCMRFRVDIARRGTGTPAINPSPGVTDPKYTNFRFNMSDGGDHVIDKYEQIWCFGFNPSNSGSPNDAEIDLASRAPTTDPELEKLDEWMTEKKGGLFGTGDHHFLGASMCRKIPRLGTMRRWTNADGVPPIGTPDRIDTLRPPSPAYQPSNPGGPLALGNGLHQGDLTVQPIRWTTDASFRVKLFKYKKRPHPVLCHPTLGPINVMPDHAHEGLCVPNPDLNATKQFNNEPEYPDAIDGGAKPRPDIIAYGSNLGDPPYNFTKGPQPARTNNPMIAVYDGHRAGVGRVATDSTWHHWMDVNINAIAIADTDDWKKISRYFQNLAVWLCPPGFSTRCTHLAVVTSHFETVGFQEYYRKAPVLELGRSLRNHLIVTLGPCWVTYYVLDVLDHHELVRMKKIPDLLRDVPELEFDGPMIEELVLGHMVQATFDEAEKIKEAGGDVDEMDVDPMPVPDKLFAKPAKAALADYVGICKRRFEIESRGFEELLR